MARPIKETPVLYGTKAKSFLERMANVEPWPQERREEIKRAYELSKKMRTGYHKLVY